MYEIVIVGTPIRSEHLDQKFIDCVNDVKENRYIAVSNGGFNNKEISACPAGSNYIIDNLGIEKYTGTLKYGVINDIDTLWNIKDSASFYEKRDPAIVIKNLLNIFDENFNKLNFIKIYIFTSGSPNYADVITRRLKLERDITVVDTPSSIELSVDIIKPHIKPNIDYIIRNYHYDFIRGCDKTYDNSKLNIFNCIQFGYEVNSNKLIVESFFSDISKFVSDDDLFFSVNIGQEKNEIIKCTFGEAKKSMLEISHYPKSLTFGICKKEYINDYRRIVS